jgi:cytidylate kinase
MTKRIITISRQYGSGGREIGQRVAQRLGFAYYDNELIRRAAKAGNIDEGFIKENDEGVMGKVSSLLTYGSSVIGKDEDTLPLADRIFLIQSRIIRQIADEGPCVIIGHSADYFLEDYPDLLNVFIHAAWDARVARVMQRNSLSEHEAVVRIKKIDHKRAVYYEQRTDQKWGEVSNYHLSLSSSFFGIEGAAQVITELAGG